VSANRWKLALLIALAPCVLGSGPCPQDFDPIARFTVTPERGTTATTFTFDASGSTWPRRTDEALEFRWDWEDDGHPDTEWSLVATAAHTYPDPGTYSVRLTIRAQQSFQSTTTRTVVVVAPSIASQPQVPGQAP
jgi:PKD repeat protein